MARVQESYEYGGICAYFMERDITLTTGRDKGENFDQITPRTKEQAKCYAFLFRRIAKRLEAMSEGLPEAEGCAGSERK